MTSIYLSSTYEDLKEYRRVVFDALRKSGYHAIAMEDYVATDQRPVEKCLKDVAEADIYVGIFAFRYGYVPPAEHSNSNSLSITELEFRRAESLKKPCLTFVVNQSTPWPPIFMDSQTAEDKGERINTFRQYLLTEKLASSFSSPHELATLVLAAVAKHQDAIKKTDDATRQKTETAPAITWDINKDGSPYPGLMHFSRKYAPVFFGREVEVREVLDRLRLPEGRFLIISGGSGTGKSSLVDAGVLPRIEEEGISGDGKYLCVRMVPTQSNHPFGSLMSVLGYFATVANVNPDAVVEELKRNPESLARHIKTIIHDGTGDKMLLLFFDQMEELFAAQASDDFKPFLSALYNSVSQTSLRVIATIRSDFLHHCHEHPEMLRVLRGPGHYPLGRVEPYMMQDMIIKPAHCAGVTIPNRLVRRLIQDTGSEPGSLPLLAFALERLFQERSGNALSESVYDALGGIAGAIGAHVTKVEDQVAKQVGADANTWLPKIFQPLVVVNIDGQPTRRRALKQTFAADLHPIVDLLSKERLLSAEGEGQQSTVSVAHEKLFETWPALTQWVAENRDDLFVLRQAEIEAKEWVKHDYDQTYLWHSDRLARLREIIHRVGDHGIDAAVREYVAPQDRLLQRLHEDLLSHQDRLTIGHSLAVLGDPRRGVGLTADGVPDIDWVVIPAGNVKLEEVKKTFKVNSFQISRYLVTNKQFESFINAEDGYHKPEWWEDIEGSPAPNRSTWLENNSPRTDISWYEAVAFCRWLSEKYHERGLLGKSQEIRLPTEWEWQQAATGGDAKNVYPWGPKWDAARCNSSESELRRTTTVGVYPNGATMQDVLDMAGNVWEWCRNKYDNPDGPSATEIDKSGGQRVVRGGSWYFQPGYLRSANRDRFDGGNRYFGTGFRLAQDLQ